MQRNDRQEMFQKNLPKPNKFHKVVCLYKKSFSFDFTRVDLIQEMI